MTTRLGYAAIRNPFSFSRTMLASDWNVPLDDQWQREKEKRRVEHELDRQRSIDAGWKLGPVIFSEQVEDESDWDAWVGEWRSEIISSPF